MTYEDDQRLACQAMEAADYEAALPVLLVLAERNSEYALLSLGWIYETGALGAPDITAAQSYYERAARAESADAYGRLGLLLLNQGQERQAETAFRRGAELGDEDSKSMLEKLTDKHEAERAWQAIEAGDYKAALRLLEPLAARNSVHALHNLGWLYETGKLGTPELNIARSYYERAAKQGSAEAYRRLGQLLLDQGNDELARTAFKYGAEAGNISCMYWLGDMMLKGQGGPEEFAEGTAWLENAAAKGHFFAKRKLLAIEEQNAGSILKKLRIKGQIAALGKEAFKEFLRDRDSDKNR
jgi:TPR repeat protein